MLYQEFKNDFFELACFSVQQVYTWRDHFDKNNLGRWVQQGLLIRVKAGFYCFPEYIKQPGIELYIANRMYRPSYISLHTALAFYGMIPEAVVQITSVTSLKTAGFVNTIGQFSYKSVKPEYMFGYEPKTLADGRNVLIADPEKSVLDLLYLYPFYNTSEEIEGLRLDEDFMRKDFNAEKLMRYVSAFGVNSLEKRAQIAMKTLHL